MFCYTIKSLISTSFCACAFVILAGECMSSYESENMSALEDFGETTRSPQDMTSRYYTPGKQTNSVNSNSKLTTNSSGQIHFIDNLNPNLLGPRVGNSTQKSKRQAPLKLLRKLYHETDVINVFEKYVSNVQFKHEQGQKYLVTSEGKPIETGLGGKSQTEESTSEKSIVKPFTGFSTFTDRNNNKQPTAMANAEINSTMHFSIQASDVTEKPESFPECDIMSEQTTQGERISSNAAGEKVTKAALCEPELKTVELPKPTDPNIIQFPRCVRLERCGGCCGSDLLSCEATRTKPTEVQVQKFSYNDELDKLEYTGTEVVKLPSHVECRCNCRVKVGDCNEKQEYSGEDCNCTCKNRGEQELCLRKPHKLWDPNLCQCICREIRACTSGLSFNLETCECSVTPEPKVPSKGTNAQRRRRDRESKRGL